MHVLKTNLVQKKIINLPQRATIKIYTIDGTLIRTLVKNDAGTNYIDWDLKNNKNNRILFIYN